MLARYDFPGKGLVDALVDLPFALPTAVAGIALTALYAENGWLGRFIEPLGIQGRLRAAGVGGRDDLRGLAVRRAHRAAGADGVDIQMEEAAATLGAAALDHVRAGDPPGDHRPALTGLALAFARAVGEYGSIVFISGNMPMKTEIVPLLIVTKLEQYDYPGATALALVMLAASFVMLLIINGLQAWIRTHAGSESQARK